MILGIGNDMRGDDGLGSILAQKLSILENENITVFDGKTVPENFTGAIKRENPSHIILLDAVEMNKSPGHIKLVSIEEIANYSISTHAMPLSFLIKYLESTTPAEIMLLGIQPENMNLICEISPKIQESLNYVLKLFKHVLKNF
ncbi:hydrogenase maturation peptidase HycI [Methanobacterium formicicum]|uniref:Hydrogenase maturation protease HycI n=1 Tax=Methanobacterium formicicum (strain DSM 3637 / PP1) TaxID=1204725 RepID=K2QB05_METFP|nr:hydrogenase maturation peptidase HycI [Methanobacterium formicicum]EKF85151.1 hydrogenase maturation protease HycI [Methanobacterium formicicum DSM 3637]